MTKKLVTATISGQTAASMKVGGTEASSMVLVSLRIRKKEKRNMAFGSKGSVFSGSTKKPAKKSPNKNMIILNSSRKKKV